MQLSKLVPRATFETARSLEGHEATVGLARPPRASGSEPHRAFATRPAADAPPPNAARLPTDDAVEDPLR